MSVTSTHSSVQPLARWYRATSCWRTSPDTCLWDLPMSLGTLPAWGMTQGGELFELPTPARHISEPGSSSLPTPKSGDGEKGRDLPRLRPDEASRELATTVAFLPTPVADHSRGLAQPGSDFQSLPNVALRLLPTVTTQDAHNVAGAAQLQRNSQPLNALVTLLPTPAVNDMGAGKDPQWWDEWAARQRASDGRPAPHGKSLEQEALRLLPTPTAQAAKHGSTPDVTAQGFGSNVWDLPTLIGASTPSPSPDGSSSSTGQHPAPPSPESTDDPDCLPFLSSG